ncbi:hypothetical protein JXJ21_18740 [candidate division KSB1 bacterium]|nr:hypothetical protein [candidate division KSB1 bacterium]
MRVKFILILSIILFLSCVSQVNVLKPEGETVRLKLKNNHKYDGELFAVNDTALFFYSQPKLYEVPLSNVENVYVHGYSLRKRKMVWSIPPMLFYGIPFFKGIKDAWLMAGSFEALTILSWFIGDPKVSFSPPLNNKDFDKLQLYCRYSQGMAPEKWKQLLQHYEQEEFLTLQ